VPAHPTTALVFDFDGVIADTERLHLLAFQEVFATRGWTLEETAYFDRYLGYDDAGLVDAYSREHGLGLDRATARSIAVAKEEAFGRHLVTRDLLFPGARERILEMAARFPLGIASGALRAEITRILQGGGVLDCFKTIVAAEDVSATKPAPEPYLKAASRLGVDPRACVAIEDSVPGVQAAHAAGMRTIAVTSTSPREALTLADCVIEGIHALTIDVIESLA
jgi:HAD superfamily hydrolase (TIGR01509 family)